jgi:hypothetical protein
MLERIYVCTNSINEKKDDHRSINQSINQSIRNVDRPTVTGGGGDARGSSGAVAEDEQYLIEHCEYVENLSAEQQPEAPVDSNAPPNLINVVVVG